MRIGVRLPSGFGYLEGLAGGLYTGAGLDSGVVQVAGTAVLKPFPRHVTILHAEAGWLENPLPGAEFDLGLSLGPRAFGSHAFTGDRSFIRATIGELLLGAGPPRPPGRTVVSPFGLAVLDLAVADLAVRRAVRTGSGLDLPRFAG